MKIALFGISEIKLGKHNLKDPRLDQADKLVEADKKTHAQVDVIGEDVLLEADGILALHENKADLILKDLEFVETRLGRDPQPAEQAALKKMIKKYADQLPPEAKELIPPPKAKRGETTLPPNPPADEPAGDEPF